MGEAEDDILQRGYQTVTLNVSHKNHGALRLYLRLGYQVVGKDPGRWSYYDERGVLRHVYDPGWRMQKWLDESTS
jgi:ribosomal protein S18 acetylase RimI-like enzyme